MRHVSPETGWPQSWIESYTYDAEEVFNRPTNLGYAYAYEVRLRETLQLIEEAVPKGSTILDIAAAAGNFSLLLAERGYRVTWNDLRTELADYVQRKHEFGEITYAPGNAFELQFPEQFDCVLFTEVIEHVAHPDEFMANVARLLKPDGIAVMTTPNGRYFANGLPRFSNCKDPSQYEAVQFRPDSGGHIFLLWPDEVRRFARQSGLTVERQTFFNTPLISGHLKTHYLLPVLPKFALMAFESMARHIPGSLRELAMVHTAARFRKQT